MLWVDPFGYVHVSNYPRRGGPPWPGAMYAGLVLDEVFLRSPSLGGREEWAPVEWPLVQEVVSTRTKVDGDLLFTRTALDDVNAEFLAAPEIRLVDCVLRGVRVRGRVTSAWIEVRDQAAVERVRQEVLGEDGEWWLDVSELEAKDLVIRGVDPARVRINPEHQAFICAEQLVSAKDRLAGIDLPGVAGDQVDWVLEGLEGPEFINVWHRDRTAAAERELLRFLHDEGLTMATANKGG